MSALAGLVVGFCVGVLSTAVGMLCGERMADRNAEIDAILGAALARREVSAAPDVIALSDYRSRHFPTPPERGRGA